MAQRIAQPPQAPDPPKAAPIAGRVFSTKEQNEFNDEADALAAKLGWSGDGKNVLLGITVEDAQNYLRKTFHEVHQSALTPELDTPEAADVCIHLGLCERPGDAVDPGAPNADDLKTVGDAIVSAYEREVKEAPQNPTRLPGTTKVVIMSAELEGNASAAVAEHLAAKGSK